MDEHRTHGFESPTNASCRGPAWPNQAVSDEPAGVPSPPVVSSPAMELANFRSDQTSSSVELAPSRDTTEVRAALLESYRVMMRSWCRNSLRGPLSARVDTSDVLQESLVQVWRNWDRMQDKSPEELQAWMYQIARGHLNKLRRHHLAGKRDVKRQANDEVDAESPSSQAPLEALERAESRMRLMIALERLPHELAEVVKLRVFAATSYREIAQRLDIGESEARCLFLKAIRRLKGQLELTETLG